MKLSKKILGSLFALSIINAAQAAPASNTEECVVKTVTSAYFENKEVVASGSDVGSLYETYMKGVNALQETGNFNNFKIVSQSIDFQPNYDNNQIISAVVRVGLEFDLNYKAITDLSTKLTTTTLNISTYEDKCARHMKKQT